MVSMLAVQEKGVFKSVQALFNGVEAAVAYELPCTWNIVGPFDEYIPVASHPRHHEGSRRNVGSGHIQFSAGFSSFRLWRAGETHKHLAL